MKSIFKFFFKRYLYSLGHKILEASQSNVALSLFTLSLSALDKVKTNKASKKIKESNQTKIWVTLFGKLITKTKPN